MVPRLTRRSGRHAGEASSSMGPVEATAREKVSSQTAGATAS